MDKIIDINLDMDVLMNELKEARSGQEIKTIEIERGSLTEKLVHLFILEEYDLFLLSIKSLLIKHALSLPDWLNLEYCSNESKKPLCTAIITNWLAIV